MDRIIHRPRVAWGLLIALALTLGPATAAHAAPPANDNFSAAQILSGASGTVTGTNAEATQESSEPCHSWENCGGASVWYRWTATATGDLTVTTQGSAIDTLLGAYTGASIGSLTVIEKNNDVDDVDTWSRLVFPVVGGSTYRLAVDGFDGATGNITLNWSLVAAPANDNFTAAQVISGSAGNTTGTNLAATMETDEPCHSWENCGGSSVWYRWVAPSAGTVTFTTDGSTFDTLLGAYSGSSLSSLSVMEKNNDFAGEVTSRLSFAATGGVTYRIAVDGFDGTTGSIALAWSMPPANDNFSSARSISATSGNTTGSNVAASAESGEPVHGGIAGGVSVWFRWSAPETGEYIFDTVGSAFNTVLAVYTGSSVNGLTQKAANNDADGAQTSKVTFVATGGTTYRIAIDGFGAATGSYVLRWLKTARDVIAPVMTHTAPSSATASVTAVFNESVRPVNTTNLVLRVAGTSTNLGGSITCVNGSGASTSCSTGNVRKAYFKPSSSLIPGQRYNLIGNPGSVTTLKDLGGNRLASTTRGFRAALTEQQSSARATYSWAKVSTSSAHGGSYTVERQANAKATYSFTGTSVTWYTVKGKSFGKAKVYIDGVDKGTFNQYASSTSYKVARTFSGLSNRAHTISIVVLGQKGSTRGTDTKIAVDAFKVGSTLSKTPGAKYHWRTISATSASGGSYTRSDLANTAVSFVFRGTGIDWYTILGKDQGKAKVYVDGVLKLTVDNYASSTSYQRVRSIRGLSDSVHTLKIVVLGTKRSTATAARIAIDKFKVI